MTKISLFFTFISLLVAIGISEIILSLHRLLRIRKLLKWYWILIVWVMIILLLIVNVWFGIFHYFHLPITNTSLGFVMMVIPLFFLLLASLAVLPDKPEAGLNLKQWYYEQKNYVFTVLLLTVLSFSILKAMQIGFQALIPLSGFMVLLLTLVLSNREWVHSTITILFLCLILFIMMGQPTPLS